MKTKLSLGQLLGFSLLTSQNYAALVVTSATPAYTGGPIDDAGIAASNSNIATPNRTNGVTFSVTFTPTLADLAGTVPLMEIGGTSNGTAILLIDGVPTWSIKPGSGDQFTADSLNDLAMGSTNTTRPVASQMTSVPITNGDTFTIALSYDGANAVRFGVQGATGADADFTLTGQTNNATNPNWSGNNTLTVGPFTELGSTGGLSGEVAGNDFGSPWDVDLATPFAGTIDSASYWNSVEPIVAVIPEPSASLLTLPLFRRKKRA